MSTTLEKLDESPSVPAPSSPPMPLKISKKEVWVMKEIAMDQIKDLKLVPGPFELAVMAIHTYMVGKGINVLDIKPLLAEYKENSTQYESNEE